MITWNDNYIMGIDQFDQEHRQLFHLADQIIARMRNRSSSDTHIFVISEALTYIYSYFDRHAKQEEAYMRAIGYEGYALHKMLHDDFQNGQLVKYRQIIESGQCREADVWDFLGSGVGWLLEHIATADMAIVNKGILAQPTHPQVDQATLEDEINFLFASTLNIEANAKIASTQYVGEYFGKAIHQKMIYETEVGEVSVISGIERSFLLDIGRMLYGGALEDEVELLLSTIQIFGVHFWGTLGQRFAGNNSRISIKESRMLLGETLTEEFRQLRPTTSLLFTSDKGKFFVSSNYTPSTAAF